MGPRKAKVSTKSQKLKKAKNADQVKSTCKKKLRNKKIQDPKLITLRNAFGKEARRPPADIEVVTIIAEVHAVGGGSDSDNILSPTPPTSDDEDFHGRRRKKVLKKKKTAPKPLESVVPACCTQVPSCDFNWVEGQSDSSACQESSDSGNQSQGTLSHNSENEAGSDPATPRNEYNKIDAQS